jgi:hypothetical protein
MVHRVDKVVQVVEAYLRVQVGQVVQAALVAELVDRVVQADLAVVEVMDLRDQMVLQEHLRELHRELLRVHLQEHLQELLRELLQVQVVGAVLEAALVAALVEEQVVLAEAQAQVEVVVRVALDQVQVVLFRVVQIILVNQYVLIISM